MEVNKNTKLFRLTFHCVYHVLAEIYAATPLYLQLKYKTSIIQISHTSHSLLSTFRSLKLYCSNLELQDEFLAFHHYHWPSDCPDWWLFIYQAGDNWNDQLPYSSLDWWMEPAVISVHFLPLPLKETSLVRNKTLTL